MNTDMQPIRDAKNHLESLYEDLRVLYPGLKSVGSPGFFTDRKRIFTQLIFEDGSKKSTQYSRLIYEVHIGRRLTSEETIDHIDGNIGNDVLDNLQILTRQENARKGPNEETLFKAIEKTKYVMNGLLNPKVQGELNKKAKLTTEDVIRIKNLQQNSYRGQDSDIAAEYGVRRETIKSIRRGDTWRHVSVSDTVESIKETADMIIQQNIVIIENRKNEISRKPERKQKKIVEKILKEKIKVKPQCQCGGNVSRIGLMCKKCAATISQKKYRRFEATKEELEKLIKEIPMSKIGEIYGVSDNAVKKRCKLLGIELKPMRGYWAKMAAGKIQPNT